MNEPTEDLETHPPDEATPAEVPAGFAPPFEFGFHDKGWSEEEWQRLLNTLVESGVGSWKEVTALVLGHLNPSQVGTSLASSTGFKRRYGKGNTMRLVMAWVYGQTGRCVDCGTRLELQADHVRGREEYDDPLDADFIDNMTIRCRRCNVVRRPSHEFGGLTYLTAEAALMWILLVLRPRTIADYIRMCRLYGMTMSDIRMQEAWAMAHWLARAEPPAYGIERDGESAYDLLLWSDSAVTRCDIGAVPPESARRIYSSVPGAAVLGFLTRRADGRIKVHEQLVAAIPFSTYDLGARPAQALCIRYTPPGRASGAPPRISDLPPRNTELLSHAVRTPEQRFRLASKTNAVTRQDIPSNAPPHGKLVNTKVAPSDVVLVASPA